MTIQLALFDDLAPVVPTRKPTGVPEAMLVILAEVALKEHRYPEGVPALGFRGAQLDRIAERGLIERVTLPDPDGDVEEGPRRLLLTDAGRAVVELYDAWAEANGWTTMREFVVRHLGAVA